MMPIIDLNMKSKKAEKQDIPMITKFFALLPFGMLWGYMILWGFTHVY